MGANGLDECWVPEHVKDCLLYSCSTSFVGGNGTAWTSSKTDYTYFRIDTASTSGCIPAT